MKNKFIIKTSNALLASTMIVGAVHFGQLPILATDPGNIVRTGDNNTFMDEMPKADFIVMRDRIYVDPFDTEEFPHKDLEEGKDYTVQTTGNLKFGIFHSSRDFKTVYAQQKISAGEEKKIDGTATYLFKDAAFDTKTGKKYDVEMTLKEMIVNTTTGGDTFSGWTGMFCTGAIPKGQENKLKYGVSYKIGTRLLDKSGQPVDGTVLFAAYDLDIRDSAEKNNTTNGKYDEGFSLLSQPKSSVYIPTDNVLDITVDGLHLDAPDSMDVGYDEHTPKFGFATLMDASGFDIQWFGNASGSAFMGTTLYTKTYVTPLLVEFVDPDGTVYGTDVVMEHEDATPPTDPEKPGYTFVGWDKEYNDVTDNLTVVAKWEPNDDVLKYDPNGGEGSMEDTLGKVDQIVLVSENAFTRPGYTFVGFNTKPDGSGTDVTGGEYQLTPEEDIVYAQWQPNDDVLKYDANGGEGSMEDTLGKVDEEVPVSKNQFTRQGYVFLGFNTKKDGSGADVTDKTYRLTPEDDIVYAQWKALTTSWVDTNGKELQPSKEGLFPDKEGDDIKGYELVETKTDKDGNIINVYKKVNQPITKWVDEDGKELKPSKEGEYPDKEGDDVSGYELVKTYTDENGNIINVYRKKATSTTKPSNSTPASGSAKTNTGVQNMIGQFTLLGGISGAGLLSFLKRRKK